MAKSVSLNKYKRAFNADIPYNVVVGLLMLLAICLYVIPILYVINASFSSAEAIYSGNMLFVPRGFTFAGYKTIFVYKGFLRSYLNSIIYCALAVAIAVPLTVMAAYPLSRDDFMAKRFIMIVYTITMFFGGGLVPGYLLIVNLGLYNSPFALILPGVSVWNIIVVRQYFVTRVGKELYEAASIDGCSNFRFLMSIGFPLCLPIIIVISMYTIVGQWNSYFSAMVYLDDREKFPVQLILRELLLSADGGGSNNWGVADSDINAKEAMKYASIIVTATPVILLYAFMQKYFVKGVMVGSLKG